ncbi:MAG: aldehyde ferredoxin oxidoreductase N-terminal domain-containing protein [bacterium]
MENMYGWVGKILRINLSNNEKQIIPTEKYVPKYIGARGIAAKIAWDEISGEVEPYDQENLLIFMTGPLTGTLAPGSGRSEFFSVAPQVYPKPWFTRSGIGGWVGSELKYAGYDGFIIEGKAEEPVYLQIKDQEINILPADDIWGQDTYATQKSLMRKHGEDNKIMCIGPAGENLVRLSIILSETKNAAGGGGLGAVMGSKKLKAIMIKGSGSINVAEPEALYNLSLAINDDYVGAAPVDRPKAEAEPEMKEAYGRKGQACSHSCPWRCGYIWRDIPGQTYSADHTALITCVANVFISCKDSPHNPYNWDLGEEAGVEIAVLADRLGLNHWALSIGFAKWLIECKEKNVMDKIGDLEIDTDCVEFWVSLMEKISYRKGIGDVLAEELPRAAEILNKGQDIVEDIYPAYGFSGHWDGRGDEVNPIFFPLWIVSALQWATDTRDPFSSGHGYSQVLTYWSRRYSWDTLSNVGKQVYGSKKAIDPEYPYQFKAKPAVWHQHESVLKDSLTLCDQTWPRLYSISTDDHYAKVNIPDYGVIEGKSFEAHLFSMVTGIDINEEELRRKAEAIYNLERALQVRNYERKRTDDEAIIPYYEKSENVPDSSGEHHRLDREKFKKLLEEYYELRGWDKKTGYPTGDKLRSLDLEDVAEVIEKKEEAECE